MKIELAMIAMMLVGQAQQKPPGNIIPAPYFTGSPLKLPASWSHEVKGGVYTVTFRDPNNEWRCAISSTVEGRNEMKSFTMFCYDTTAEGNKPQEIK